jgi:hypothetical protein
MTIQCDICGRVHDEDQNRYGLMDEEGNHLAMCGLHAEASRLVAVDNRINPDTMRLATLRLDRVRPSLPREPEKWVDWHPMERLVEFYHDVQEGKEFQEPEKITPIKPVALRINVPGDLVRQVSESKLIEKDLLALLARCTGRPIITGEPESNIDYDDFAEPRLRTEKYGDMEYGLSMEAVPISSGVGVHGEESEWAFQGLPEGMRISARSRLDMRGGDTNYYSMEISGDHADLPELVKHIKSVFAEGIKKLIRE